MTTYPDPNYLPASGNYMDLLKDEAWFQQMIEAERLIKGDIIAGVPGRRGWMKTWPRLKMYDEYMQVRSMVLRGFSQIIRDGNLGAGQDAALDCGKNLVFERMMDAAAEVQERVLALIDWNYIGPKTELTSERMTVLKEVFREVMTADDWAQISTAATTQIHQQVMTLTDAGTDSQAA